MKEVQIWESGDTIFGMLLPAVLKAMQVGTTRSFRSKPFRNASRTLSWSFTNILALLVVVFDFVTSLDFWRATKSGKYFDVESFFEWFW